MTNTVKWPSSGGSMGGPGLFGAIGGFMSNMFGGKPPEPKMVPYPVPVPKPIPIPVTKIVTVEAKTVDAYGVDTFSGKFVKL